MQSVVYDMLKSVVGDKYFITEPEKLYIYAKDITSKSEIVPYAVILPGTVDEISRIARICNGHKVNLTVRGGGTGVSGGARAYSTEVVVSVERLNKILEINKVDRMAVVEAGVITSTLQEEVLKEGLYFPQNISSRNSCFIGGNVAVSSGSPKSLKYGPTKNYILNMEVVLPNGQIMWTGKNTNKNAAGYNFTQLFAGSEGTLGIITKIVVQLVEPAEEILVLAPFRSVENLFNCTRHFFLDGPSASSIEFMDKTGYELVSKFEGKADFFEYDIEGLLWLEFDGKDKQQLVQDMVKISEVIKRYTDDDILIAETKDEITALWTFRNRIGEAVMNYFNFRDIYIVVPRSKIWQMYGAIRRITAALDLRYTVFGHIGDGNFHINIFKPECYTAEQWGKIIDKGITDIFAMAVQFGGTISGEHGIGEIQRSYLKLAIPEYQINFMKEIKKIFDPNGILNPGKIF